MALGFLLAEVSPWKESGDRPRPRGEGKRHDPHILITQSRTLTPSTEAPRLYGAGSQISRHAARLGRGEVARRALADAHRLRRHDGAALRRGRRAGAAGRRLGSQRRLRLRDDHPDHHGRVGAAGRGRHQGHSSRPGRRRHAVRHLPGLARSGARRKLLASSRRAVRTQ